MAILKCKMCGGDLNVTADEKIIECEFCGTTQTIPDGNDEKKTNLFNRANRLRIANEFDKAAGIYESIIAEFPYEAESYWGLCLCKFGIEYVDDPKTAKKIPTCHRTSFESIFDDENYKMVIEKSDVIAQGVYKEEATVIDNLQKDILSIVHKEEPFDVFICYKETDELGQRTQDSVLAQDIYDALTDKGFKVFFSRITLEDKLGKQYEPYIFAALNSAKVMLAIGTKEEYYNAVWVKNEWSRFLALMETDKSKMLIPCYRDIDPYDMPQEFKNLQGQDMSKLGFLQDLVRGISKIVAPEQNKPANAEAAPTTSANATTDSLLKRVFMFLEDGNWKSAEEYCEKVLDINPECAEAYLGKLMQIAKVQHKEGLLTCDKSYIFNGSAFKNLKKFGNSDFINKLIEHSNRLEEEKILKQKREEEQNRLRKQQEEEQRIKEEMEHAENLRRQKEQAERHAKLLKEYQDKFPISIEKEETEENIKQTRMQLAEITRKYGSRKLAKFVYIPGMIMFGAFCLIALYGSCAFIFTEESIEGGIYMLLMSLLFGGFFCWFYIANKKRVKQTAEAEIDLSKYEEILAEIKALPTLYEWSNDKSGTEKLVLERKERKQIEKEKQEKAEREEKARIAKRNKKIAIIGSVVAAIAIVFVIILNSVVIPNSKYNKAIKLMGNEEYQEAYDILSNLEHKDSAKKAEEIKNVLLPTKELTELCGEAFVKKYVENGKITFGSYEQDNNVSNGKEKITWKLVAKESKRVYVVSEYALSYGEFKKYDASFEGTPSWFNSSIRNWLNNDFYNDAFTDQEKKEIATINYINSNGEQTGDYDNITLLSLQEVEKFITITKDRTCTPTVYASSTGGGFAEEPNENTAWWLRTKGDHLDHAAIISEHGYNGSHYVSSVDAVRPALWISLNDN